MQVGSSLPVQSVSHNVGRVRLLVFVGTRYYISFKTNKK